MLFLWGIIRDFMKPMLATRYNCDKELRGDRFILDWCMEIHTKGQMTSFSSITTVDQLIYIIVMCLHTALP